MKTSHILLALSLAASAPAFAQAPVPHITVAGQSYIELEPDLLRWQLQVSYKGSEVGPVADEHAKRAGALIDFLKKQGIAAAQIQTSRMRISPYTEFRQPGNVRIEGFSASTDVFFTSKDVSAYRDLWIGMSKLEGVSVQNSTWDSSKTIESRAKVRLEALKLAREKAVAMAAALDGRIGETLEIEEEGAPSGATAWATGASFYQTDNGGHGISNAISNSVADGNSDSVSPGTIVIRARVGVTFRLLTK